MDPENIRETYLLERITDAFKGPYDHPKYLMYVTLLRQRSHVLKTAEP